LLVILLPLRHHKETAAAFGLAVTEGKSHYELSEAISVSSVYHRHLACGCVAE